MCEVIQVAVSKKGKIVRVYDMEAYGGVEVWFHACSRLRSVFSFVCGTH
jgi:hypothetical protein